MLKKTLINQCGRLTDPYYTITVAKSQALYTSYQRGYINGTEGRYGNISRTAFENDYNINRLCGNIKTGLGFKGSWICFDGGARPGTIYVKRMDTNDVFIFSSFEEYGYMTGYFIEDAVLFNDEDVGKNIECYISTNPPNNLS